jgi:hypothetical protein
MTLTIHNYLWFDIGLVSPQTFFFVFGPGVVGNGGAQMSAEKYNQTAQINPQYQGHQSAQ